MGSNPIGHPSSNPLQLCVVRDFFLSIYLLPLSLLAVRPPNHSATRFRSLSAPGMPLSSCLALVVAAVRVEWFVLDRKVPPAYFPALTRAPISVAAENDLPRFIVVCEAGQIVSLGEEVMPRRRCVSRKDCLVLSKRTFPRARERVRTPQFFVFCLHPSPACVRCSKSNRCGEGKGEGRCSPLPSPLCGSRLDCCGFWHEGGHVLIKSPLLFRIFVRYFPSALSEKM